MDTKHFFKTFLEYADDACRIESLHFSPLGRLGCGGQDPR